MGRIAGIYFMFMLTNLSAVFGQNLNNPPDSTRFYMTHWLIDLPDTVMVYETFDSIPKWTRYSVVTKLKGKNYDLHSWTEEWNKIESPTTFEAKLKMHVSKSGNVIVNFGQNRKGVYSIDRNRLILIEKNN